MKIIKLHKEKLFRLENNPRQIIDKKAVDKLRALIKGHGFRGVLDVFKHKSGKYEILCGNHRFDAGVEEGMEEFDCQIYEGSRKKALARAISDNKSSEWTDWYIPGLKDFITEIDDGSVDMYLTGFETKEIKDLFDNDPAANDTPEEKPKAETCPRCGQKIKDEYDII